MAETKDKICISIDKQLHADLQQHCGKNLIKLSTYIEYVLKQGHQERKKR